MTLHDRIKLYEEKHGTTMELPVTPEVKEKPSKVSECNQIANGISSSVSGLIQDTWQTIDSYKNVLSMLETLSGVESIIEILQENLADEYTHIGALEKAFSLVSPGSNGIETGKKEADKQLEDNDNTSKGKNESLSPDGYEPKSKGVAYKVFRVKNGKLYPPMVANRNNEDTPVGVWLDADEGEFAGLSKTGRPQVKSVGSGTLSYRPGWHLGDIPRAKQFDRLNKDTGEYEFPKDFVWAECEYAMDVDYQPESDARGYERTKLDKDGNVITTKSDKYQHSLAGLSKLPKDGFYKYRTNPNPDTVPWVITGQMRVVRLLDDNEVNEILAKKGIAPIHRQGGDKTLAELGL